MVFNKPEDIKVTNIGRLLGEEILSRRPRIGSPGK
jgi:hypothetical protein